MNQFLSLTLLSTSLLASSFSVSAGSTWQCKHGQQLREIVVMHDTDAAAPCSVVYKKPTEGLEEQVLWTAQSDGNYCEEKAQYLVDKQTGWGWACESTMMEKDGMTKDPMEDKIMEDKPMEDKSMENKPMENKLGEAMPAKEEMKKAMPEAQ